MAPPYERPPLPVTNASPDATTAASEAAASVISWPDYFADRRIRSLIELVFARSLRHVLIVLLGVCLLQPQRVSTEEFVSTDEFAFLQPWFDAQPKERDKLAQGGVVVRALPGSRDQISVIAACRVAISPQAFVVWIGAAGEFSGGQMMIGRLSNRPSIDDLAELTLDPGDLDRLRRCRPGDCRLNLADFEMVELQRALAASGGSPAEVQQVFRRTVLNRIARYQSGGLEAVPPYHDHRDAVQPAVIFADIIRQSPYLTTNVPDAAVFLQRFPRAETAGVGSFLRWSKVIINKKAVVMVTHVSIFRPDPGPGVPTVLVAGKQVFASRYMHGDLALTMLFGGADGSPGYLVHVVRSALDTLGGSLGGLKRTVIERRVRQEAADAVAMIRESLERGL